MICAICGGTGGARLARGFGYVFDPATLTYICNVGDNLRLFDLTICPGIDTIIYYLFGTADYSRGWRLHIETVSQTRLHYEEYFMKMDVLTLERQVELARDLLQLRGISTA